MTELYRATAINDDGGRGTTWAVDGPRLRVASPLDPPGEEPATNPEQLLALAWSTCLAATVRVILGDDERRSRVRVDVTLVPAVGADGYEFELDAYIALEAAAPGESERVRDAAHARCPISRLVREARAVRVHTEPFAS